MLCLTTTIGYRALTTCTNLYSVFHLPHNPVKQVKLNTGKQQGATLYMATNWQMQKCDPNVLWQSASGEHLDSLTTSSHSLRSIHTQWFSSRNYLITLQHDNTITDSISGNKSSSTITFIATISIAAGFIFRTLESQALINIYNIETYMYNTSLKMRILLFWFVNELALSKDNYTDTLEVCDTVCSLFMWVGNAPCMAKLMAAWERPDSVLLEKSSSAVWTYLKTSVWGLVLT